MLADIHRHSTHYAVLGIIVALGLIGFSTFNYQVDVQQKILVLTGAAYIVWGIIHHHLTDKVTSKIVLEYVLIALISGLIINTLLINR